MPAKTADARPARRKKAPAGSAAPAVAHGPALPVLRLAQELRRWTDNVLGLAGKAAELSLDWRRRAPGNLVSVAGSRRRLRCCAGRARPPE